MKQAPSGCHRGRRPGRRGARRGTRTARRVLRAGRNPRRPAADPQGPEPHQPHARALLLLGHRRRVARRAADAARLSDRRAHRLRQPGERILAGAGGPRAGAPYYFEANERLPQYRMEAVLRKKMASLPSVESRFGWTAKTVEQDATACASPSPRKRAPDARCWRPTMSWAATAATRSCAARSGSSAAAPTSTRSWCWWCSARASCTRGSSAFRNARPIA